MKNFFSTLFVILLVLQAQAQEFVIPLWEGTPPLQRESNDKETSVREGILRIANVQKPTIEIYLPTRQIANGKAIVIFPGGGYGILAYDWEGTDFAKWLNAQGIAGIVVKYRLPKSESLTDPKEVPLLDAQRAIRLVRHHATQWKIDPNQIGVMGFSAGGHLASTLSTQYTHEVARSKDALDSLSARPDFSVLVYPVISFRNASAHAGSRNALIGADASQELIDRFSGELNVTANTPPTFLVHAQDDKGVPIENSLLYYKALHTHQVKAALHIYPSGGHGFGFGLGKGSLEQWREVLLGWLEDLNKNFIN